MKESWRGKSHETDLNEDGQRLLSDVHQLTVLAGKPAFGGLPCSGAPMTAYPRQCTHDSVPTVVHPQQRGDISVLHDGMCVLVCVANIVAYLPAMQLLLVVIATIIGKLLSGCQLWLHNSMQMNCT